MGEGRDFGRTVQIALLRNGCPAMFSPITFGVQPEEFAGINPWLEISREVAEELFQALGTYLQGVKLKTQLEVEATLAATEAHLRDVRYLLKLPHPDIIKGGKKT